MVQTLAKELGYNVIEVKSCDLRSGTAVKKLVAEAASSQGIVLDGSRSGSQSTKGANKKAKKGTVGVGPKDKLNLILFDEVDLVFEEDTGYVHLQFSIFLSLDIWLYGLLYLYIDRSSIYLSMMVLSGALESQPLSSYLLLSHPTVVLASHKHSIILMFPHSPTSLSSL